MKISSQLFLCVILFSEDADQIISFVNYACWFRKIFGMQPSEFRFWSQGVRPGIDRSEAVLKVSRAQFLKLQTCSHFDQCESGNLTNVNAFCFELRKKSPHV